MLIVCTSIPAIISQKWKGKQVGISLRKCTNNGITEKKMFSIVSQTCSAKKLSWKKIQNSQQNTLVRAWKYITIWYIRSILIKKSNHCLGHSIQTLYVEVIYNQLVRPKVQMVSLFFYIKHFHLIFVIFFIQYLLQYNAPTSQNETHSNKSLATAANCLSVFDLLWGWCLKG